MGEQCDLGLGHWSLSKPPLHSCSNKHQGAGREDHTQKQGRIHPTHSLAEGNKLLQSYLGEGLRLL